MPDARRGETDGVGTARLSPVQPSELDGLADRGRGRGPGILDGRHRRAGAEEGRAEGVYRAALGPGFRWNRRGTWLNSPRVISGRHRLRTTSGCCRHWRCCWPRGSRPLRSGHGAPRWSGFTLLLGADGFGVAQLAIHGDAFAHGPHRHIAAMVRRLGPDHVAIVHDGGSKVPGHIYSPLRYEFGRGLRQYIYHHGEGNRIQVEPYPVTESRETQESLATVPVDHVLVIRSEFQGAADIAGQLRRGIGLLWVMDRSYGGFSDRLRGNGSKPEPGSRSLRPTRASSGERTRIGWTAVG